jgi:DNA-binding Xre family transcriptional regulator
MSGRSQNINTELLLEICKEFGLDIKDIIPTRTEQESKENSP